MAGTGLQCLAVMHQRFYRIGCNCTCEFLLLGLLSLDRGDSQNLLQELRIYIQHLQSSLLRFFCSSMCGMSFLPQELSGTQERSGLLLPTYHGTPLIVYLRQVSVGMDVILIEITEQGL